MANRSLYDVNTGQKTTGEHIPIDDTSSKTIKETIGDVKQIADDAASAASQLSLDVGSLSEDVSDLAGDVSGFQTQLNGKLSSSDDIVKDVATLKTTIVNISTTTSAESQTVIDGIKGRIGVVTKQSDGLCPALPLITSSPGYEKYLNEKGQWTQPQSTRMSVGAMYDDYIDEDFVAKSNITYFLDSSMITDTEMDVNYDEYTSFGVGELNSTTFYVSEE
jgi:hypothetical protein